MPYGTSYINQGSTGGGGAAVSPPNVFQTMMSTRGADGTQPSATQGTSVTPGTLGVKGTYANLGVLSASVDMYEIELVVHSVSVSASNRMICIDIAVDPTGGTSFTPVITDFLVGSPSTLSTSQESVFRIPLKVAAGSSVGIRAVSLDSTVTAFRAYINAWGNPSKPTLIKSGTACQTLGAATSGSTFTGTAVTPGTTSDGSWVQVGTLTQDIIGLELGVHINNTTVNAILMEFDVAIGASSGTARMVIQNRAVGGNTAETVWQRGRGPTYCNGVAGENVYVRAQTSVAQTGVEAAVYALY